MAQHRRAQLRTRIGAAVVLGVGGIVGASLIVPASGTIGATGPTQEPAASPVARTHDRAARKQSAAAEREAALRADREKYGDVAEFLRRESGKDGDHGHTHHDAATKNAISRSEESTAEAAADPTTEGQATRARAAAEGMRA